MNIPDPQTFTDPEKLRKLMANAVRLGHPDLVFGCQLRIAELVGSAHEAGLEREFWTTLAAVEELKTETNGRTTRMTNIRQKHRRLGAQRVLTDWAMQTDITDGFERLVAEGRSDLTGEAIVVRHEDLFSVDAVNAARRKLMEHGVNTAEGIGA